MMPSLCGRERRQEGDPDGMGHPVLGAPWTAGLAVPPCPGGCGTPRRRGFQSPGSAPSLCRRAHHFPTPAQAGVAVGLPRVGRHSRPPPKPCPAGEPDLRSATAPEAVWPFANLGSQRITVPAQPGAGGAGGWTRGAQDSARNSGPRHRLEFFLECPGVVHSSGRNGRWRPSARLE